MNDESGRITPSKESAKTDLKAVPATKEASLFRRGRAGFALFVGAYLALISIITAVIAMTEGFDWIRSWVTHKQ